MADWADHVEREVDRSATARRGCRIRATRTRGRSSSRAWGTPPAEPGLALLMQGDRDEAVRVAAPSRGGLPREPRGRAGGELGPPDRRDEGARARGRLGRRRGGRDLDARAWGGGGRVADRALRGALALLVLGRDHEAVAHAGRDPHARRLPERRRRRARVHRGAGRRRLRRTRSRASSSRSRPGTSTSRTSPSRTRCWCFRRWPLAAGSRPSSAPRSSS